VRYLELLDGRQVCRRAGSLCRPSLQPPPHHIVLVKVICTRPRAHLRRVPHQGPKVAASVAFGLPQGGTRQRRRQKMTQSVMGVRLHTRHLQQCPRSSSVRKQAGGSERETPHAAHSQTGMVRQSSEPAPEFKRVLGILKRHHEQGRSPVRVPRGRGSSLARVSRGGGQQPDKGFKRVVLQGVEYLPRLCPACGAPPPPGPPRRRTSRTVRTPMSSRAARMPSTIPITLPMDSPGALTAWRGGPGPGCFGAGHSSEHPRCCSSKGTQAVYEVQPHLGPEAAL